MDTNLILLSPQQEKLLTLIEEKTTVKQDHTFPQNCPWEVIKKYNKKIGEIIIAKSDSDTVMKNYNLKTMLSIIEGIVAGLDSAHCLTLLKDFGWYDIDGRILRPINKFFKSLSTYDRLVVVTKDKKKIVCEKIELVGIDHLEARFRIIDFFNHKKYTISEKEIKSISIY